MSQLSGVDDVFNQHGDMEIEVDFEETAVPPTPPPGGAAGDGPPQPQRQRQGRRGLVRGTKRGPYKRAAPDARIKHATQAIGRKEMPVFCFQMSFDRQHTYQSKYVNLYN